MQFAISAIDAALTATTDAYRCGSAAAAAV